MTTRPPLGCSVPNMVQRYLGTEYDTVKLIADNIGVISLVGRAIIDADKVTFATVVPDAETTLTPWFVNLATSKTYLRVTGKYATYWVEQNSHGQL